MTSKEEFVRSTKQIEGIPGQVRSRTEEVLVGKSQVAGYCWTIKYEVG